MGQIPAYAVVRVNDERYRVDRVSGPGIGAAAFVIRFRDRLGNPLGWRLRPLVVMQGARSRVHPTAAAALASTKLLTPKKAKDALAQADRSSTVLVAETQP